jgi:uncharacterized membrane-anchored protein
MNAKGFVAAARALAAASLLVLFASASIAQLGRPDPQAELAAAFAAAKEVAQSGPTDVTLGDQAVLTLPEGFVYVPPAEGGRILTALGNTAGGGLLGLVFPTDESSWIVVMRYLDSGYIRDDDAKDWNANASRRHSAAARSSRAPRAPGCRVGYAPCCSPPSPT